MEHVRKYKRVKAIKEKLLYLYWLLRLTSTTCRLFLSLLDNLIQCVNIFPVTELFFVIMGFKCVYMPGEVGQNGENEIETWQAGFKPATLAQSTCRTHRTNVDLLYLLTQCNLFPLQPLTLRIHLKHNLTQSKRPAGLMFLSHQSHHAIAIRGQSLLEAVLSHVLLLHPTSHPHLV